MTGVSVVTFDLWDTLYSDDPRLDSARKAERYAITWRAARAGGASPAEEDVARACGQVAAAADRRWLRGNGTTGATDRLRAVMKLLGGRLPEPDLARFAAEIEDVGLHLPPRPFAQTAELIGRARERFRLGLISDTGQTPGRHLLSILKADGLADSFEVFCFSDEIGAAKPSAVPFRRALSALGASAAAGAHVGDNSRTDVKGALAAELQAVHLAPRPCSVYGRRKGYRHAPGLVDVARALEC